MVGNDMYSEDIESICRVEILLRLERKGKNLDGFLLDVVFPCETCELVVHFFLLFSPTTKGKEERTSYF